MSDMEIKNQTYENKLRFVKLSMLIWEMPVALAMWKDAEIPGPFDFDQLAAVRIDEEEPDTEWDEMFRPTDFDEVN